MKQERTIGTTAPGEWSRSGKLTLVLLFTNILVFGVGCQSETEVDLSDDLLGVWTTSVASHQDRYFELKEETLILGTGGETYTVNPIDKIVLVPENGKNLYTIYYRPPGQDLYEFSFYYQSTEGVIQFKNQDHIVWTRQPAG